MTNCFDAVVVGGGLGGLAAAAALARAGRSVRLLERHVQPGGYATTFTRGPFEFEASLHELSGIGTPQAPGPLYRTLERLDVAKRLTFLPIPDLYRAVAPRYGLDMRLPASRQGATEALLDAFPHERAGITRVMDDLFAIERDVDRLSDGVDLSTPEVIARYPAFARAARSPLAALLYREVGDPLARLALGQMWSYFGLPPSRLSLLLFASGLTTYLSHGACTIKGKSQALSNALVAVIEDAGGVVTLGDGAREIACSSNRVSGVITDHGEQLQTETVVANANPLIVAFDLVGPDRFPAAFIRRISRCAPSISTVCVHLGLSNDRRALGLDDHEVFINGTVDLEQQYRDACQLEPSDSFLLTAYNVVDADFSPQGTCVVSLVAACDGRAWSKLDSAGYRALKRRYAEQLVARAAELYPGLEHHIDVEVISTPITNTRYTGNIAGAIYGFAPTPDENPAFRLPQRAPIDGLWFAGAWTQPGGGYQPSIESGVAAADAVLTSRS
ncbi:MAG: NAD(P)/FAD-dependent oxidoreductase [Myxococcales bacterium]|nr:NAD(P)/FAD-dependent oxidoreductase [Myxococcales bacterium]